MKINVIGLGYIGLPTSLILASKEFDVVGTDLNKTLVDTLQDNKVTFEEEGLFQLYEVAVKNGLRFSLEYEKSDIYIITVPTPFIKETKKMNHSYIVSAVNSILDVCDNEAIIVIESTVSPGTISKFIRPILLERNSKVHLVHAPERILPGAMIEELMTNSRTIGADDKKIGMVIYDIYKSFCQGEIVLTDIETAEMSKVVENTYRDINIAFANELAQICKVAGLDVHEVIRISNKHPRVNILSPGPGVGGHCISVDPWFLVGDYPEHTNLIHSARIVNDGMPKFILQEIQSIMKKEGINDFEKVGLYGLTYKENVDDVRESPTFQLLDVMGETEVQVFDPMIVKKIHDNQVMDFEKFVGSIDLMVVLVGHSHLESAVIPENVIVYDTKNVVKNRKTYKL